MIFFSYVVEVEDDTCAKVTDTDPLLQKDRMASKVSDLQCSPWSRPEIRTPRTSVGS